MAFFLNPVGKVIPELAKMFGHPLNTKWILLTGGDDTLVLTKNIGPHVILGLGGNDTFNEAALPTPDPLAAYYGGFNNPKYIKTFWAGLQKALGKVIPFEPWKGKQNDIFHTGNDGSILKMGLGADKVIIHGGNQKEGVDIFVAPWENDRVYMAGDEEDVIHFVYDTKSTKVDSDGKGWTSKILEIDVRGDNPENFISDNQRANLIFKDSGGHFDSPTHNTYRATWVDHDTFVMRETDVQKYIDHIDLVLV